MERTIREKQNDKINVAMKTSGSIITVTACDVMKSDNIVYCSYPFKTYMTSDIKKANATYNRYVRKYIG